MKNMVIILMAGLLAVTTPNFIDAAPPAKKATGACCSCKGGGCSHK